MNVLVLQGIVLVFELVLCGKGMNSNSKIVPFVDGSLLALILKKKFKLDQINDSPTKLMRKYERLRPKWNIDTLKELCI